MARYAVRWVTHAEQQRDSLPPDARAALDQLLDLLTADPRRHGTYSKSDDLWTAPFGPYGLVAYTIEDNLITITVLRVIWT
jgi:mRNA-degrading endonuclease RelE of RelBE toxin-antitoxin system